MVTGEQRLFAQAMSLFGFLCRRRSLCPSGASEFPLGMVSLLRPASFIGIYLFFDLNAQTLPMAVGWGFIALVNSAHRLGRDHRVRDHGEN
jgi:hypothetical protein